jgi:hypothetical protein
MKTSRTPRKTTRGDGGFLPESEFITMHHGSSMLVAVSCAAFATLPASAVPDDSQFGPCDIMELVMVVDSSESLEPSKELCVSIEVARDGLDPEFHRTVVVAEGGYPVTCSEGFVNDLYPLQPDLVPGTSIDSYEDWGDAISVICSAHQWRSSPRVLVVFSDECAEGGNDLSTPCVVDLPNESRCGLEDDKAIERALISALNHDVRIIAVATTGACDEVVSGMHRLADGTGGRLIEQSRLQDPSSIGLGVAIQNRVASLMPENWTSCCEDLDRDGRIGPMDLSMLLGSWGVADVRMDLDRSGAVDAADLARLLGGWGGCQ